MAAQSGRRAAGENTSDPGRIMISAPISASPTPIARLRPKRSPRKSAAPSVISTGFTDITAAAFARPISTKPKKKQLVAISRKIERKSCRPG